MVFREVLSLLPAVLLQHGDKEGGGMVGTQVRLADQLCISATPLWCHSPIWGLTRGSWAWPGAELCFEFLLCLYSSRSSWSVSHNVEKYGNVEKCGEYKGSKWSLNPEVMTNSHNVMSDSASAGSWICHQRHEVNGVNVKTFWNCL